MLGLRRKVKDVDELKRVALERGMTIKGASGRVFNSAKVKAKPLPKAPPPAPEPPAPPIEVPVGPNQHEIALIRQMEEIAAGINASASVTRDLAVQIASKTETKSGPHGWTFDIERGDDGLIERIIANPRRLN